MQPVWQTDSPALSLCTVFKCYQIHQICVSVSLNPAIYTVNTFKAFSGSVMQKQQEQQQ